MHRLSLRIGLLVLGIAITAGLGYRAYQDERALTAARTDAAHVATLSTQAADKLADLRASLHAYVAPGQNLPFWATKAQTTMDALRQDVATLNDIGSPLGASMTESLDGLRQLAAAERRARTHVSRDESLLAGDVIFTEGRDLMAAIASQLTTLSTTTSTAYERRAASARIEQQWLGAGALGVWLLIAIALVAPVARPAVKDPAEWRQELKTRLAKPEAPPAPPVADIPLAVIEEVAPPVVAPAPVGVAVSVVQEVAGICADLSTLSESSGLERALARVNAMLDATGLIVWVASADARSLSPVALSGYDPKLLARIGSIPSDDANLTAAAFRQELPQTADASATAPAAIAVALSGPSGPSGVLSVELKPGQAVDEGKVALVSIVAAQLSTLATPAEPASTVEELQRAAV